MQTARVLSRIFQAEGADPSCLYDIGIGFARTTTETEQDRFTPIGITMGSTTGTTIQGAEEKVIPDGSFVFAIADGEGDYVAPNDSRFLKLTRGPKGSTLKMKVRIKGTKEQIEVVCKRDCRLLRVLD